MPFFELIKKDENSRARAGIIHTDHGDIETPAFMPVGTQASVKTLDQKDLEDIGARIILGNTYHLHLRPGEDLISGLGGLHKFMNWNRPILTDSGGFQVFSLGLQKRNSRAASSSPPPQGGEGRSPLLTEEGGGGGVNGQLVSIDEDGVTFRSHLDGSSHRFTPESAAEIQRKLGADIIMAFDECTPDACPPLPTAAGVGRRDADEKYTREAMERTHRWAERCLAEHKRLSTSVILNRARRSEESLSRLSDRQGSLAPHCGGLTRDDNTKPYRQFLFGIVQGSNYKHLREESARFISSLDFDGIAIGGESIGYNMEATKNILDWVYPIIPENKPRYAMGVGLNPADLLIAVERGADMFDCVAPTRLARHGMLFTRDLIPTFSSKEKEPQNPLLRGEGRVRSGRSHRLNITNAQFAADAGPIDPQCGCSTCKNYSRAYLHHLFNAQEMSAMRLASIHNLYFMLNLMKEARKAILENKFSDFKKIWE